MSDSKKIGLTLIILLSITTLTILYSEGWRIRLPNTSEDGTSSVERPKIQKTGMIAIRSIPEGAKVYINDKAVTATDDTITSLSPGKYRIVVKKEGFETWSKEIEVFPELVTDITAILVLQSPKLEPLTNTDVTAYDMAHNYNELAYITKSRENPGIWKLSLAGTPINLLKNNSEPLIKDNEYASPSLGENLWWSPDDKELLVKMNDNGYLLYKIDNNSKNNIPESITDVDKTLNQWASDYETDFLNKKIESVTSDAGFPEWLKDDLDKYQSEWSPDENKFYIIKDDKYLRHSYAKTKSTDQGDTSENDNTNSKESNPPQKPSTTNTNQKSDKNIDNQLNVIVYNSENPLPVGEKELTFPVKIDDVERTHIFWYSDSYHLIVVTQDPKISNYYTIELVRIDGTNRTTIYSGLLASYKAYPTPSGDKIIVLTSLKDDSPTNLYGISIR